MKIAANFVIGGIVFTGLIVGGAILGCLATYGLCRDEIEAGREIIANRRAREEYQRNAWGRVDDAGPQKKHKIDYVWGYERHNTNESEEPES